MRSRIADAPIGETSKEVSSQTHQRRRFSRARIGTTKMHPTRLIQNHSGIAASLFSRTEDLSLRLAADRSIASSLRKSSMLARSSAIARA